MKDSIIQLSAVTTGSFKQRLDGLSEQLTRMLSDFRLGPESILWSRVFLSDAANQLSEVLKHPLYVDTLSRGAFSYVEQPPLDGSKVALMLAYTKDPVTHRGTPDRHVLQCGGRRHLYQSVRFTAEDATRLTPKEQTKEAFRRHIAWLESEGLTLRDNCVRTWLFVRDIDHNYHDVVVGRNEIFAEQGLTKDTHFIASTGIGGNGANGAEAVCVDFWSVDDADMEVHYLQALDHLNPTHEYGVAFERGTAFTSCGVRRLLISGTASIDRFGNCVFQGDVLRQADRLFENIEHLLADGGASLSDMQFLYVYLRDLSDADIVRAYLQRRFPTVPNVLLLAPVCRPGWLIEAECIAVCPS